jgi:hypothetical protein
MRIASPLLLVECGSDPAMNKFRAITAPVESSGLISWSRTA